MTGSAATDGTGGMERIRVSMAHHPDLFTALDTTPRPANRATLTDRGPVPILDDPDDQAQTTSTRRRTSWSRTRTVPHDPPGYRRCPARPGRRVRGRPGCACRSGADPSRLVHVLAGGGVPGIGPDCKGDPPLPASPSGQLGLRPAVTSTADPFTTAGVSIASVYGTNYQWWAYDNGCGAGSDIMPRLTTNIANVIGLQLPGLLLAIGQGLFTAVIDPSGWIGFLDKPIEHATASVAAGVWFPFLSLALLLVAVVTLLRAARGRLAATITATVWALTVLVLVTWVVGYPAESVKLLDSGIQTAVVATAQGFGPDAQRVGPQAPTSTADS